MIRKIKMNRKGQLKIQEMAFVLLGVVFLFALVLLFYVSFQYRAWQSVAVQSEEARAITLLEVVASMPEFRCSSSFSSTSEAVCMDIDKLDYFNKTRSMRDKYAVLWESAQAAGVEVQEIYPGKGTYTIYSKQNFQGSSKTYSTYASLCYQEYGQLICKIAKIKIKMIMPESK
jgi:hypothetical protein